MVALLILASAGAPRAFAGDPELDAALVASDTDAIIARIGVLAKTDPELAVALVPAAYSAIEQLGDAGMLPEDRFRVFKKAASALASIRAGGAIAKIEEAIAKSKDSRIRFLCLHAALLSANIDAVKISIVALKDASPFISATAARCLGRSKKAEAIYPLVAAMERWETPATRETAKKGRKSVSELDTGKAWLACRDALYRLTGESMFAAADYKNFLKLRFDSIDPAKIDIEKIEAEKVTGVGLFGLEITGINIAFVLDISGSMEATDPLTPEQEEKLNKRRTGVSGAEDEELKAMIEIRKRILRAKREVTRAIRSLPEDRNFNLIVYSTKVKSWSEKLVAATAKNKDAVAEFIEAIVPEGVTVTDDALLAAFEDPSIDTIYLVTDGAPTHVGTSGPGLPPDAKELMDRIVKDTAARNYLRGVRLFALGFKEAEEEFLKKLAKENDGLYRRIE
ncbi:MAG: VWA domain-containing protein [Planctomycetes bacterium]|nr:VWA domain-containing protein [Planctomycetota bacterium]